MRWTLLIAESDAGLRNIIRRFFMNCGFEVETASDAQECLEQLRLVNPAVLVLDRELGCGGADRVLARLREEPGLSAAAVVLTTTASAPPETVEDIGPPVVRLLAKPMAPTVLLDGVRAAVAEERNEEAPINSDRGAVYTGFPRAVDEMTGHGQA
jgi:DNA-binding response OmpR family regulator